MRTGHNRHRHCVRSVAGEAAEPAARRKRGWAGRGKAAEGQTSLLPLLGVPVSIFFLVSIFQIHMNSLICAKY